MNAEMVGTTEEADGAREPGRNQPPCKLSCWEAPVPPGGGPKKIEITDLLLTWQWH